MKYIIILLLAIVVIVLFILLVEKAKVVDRIKNVGNRLMNSVDRMGSMIDRTAIPK
jgi:hypothetical protein